MYECNLLKNFCHSRLSIISKSCNLYERYLFFKNPIIITRTFGQLVCVNKTSLNYPITSKQSFLTFFKTVIKFFVVLKLLYRKTIHHF